MKWRGHVLTALLAAALCVMAPVAVPLWSLPFTLATLGIYLAAGLLGPWRGAAAVGLYLALGAVGVPVFAGFSAGFPVLFGPTGGFLWGYLPCVIVAGLLCRRARTEMTTLCLAGGTMVLYAVGVVWTMVQTQVDLATVLLTCVMFTLPGEAVKIAVATALIIPLRGRVRRLLSAGVKARDNL
ncbi:MAG: biotin transporter BioY [Clostridia bacterium]|nr:biotin transporter BioY [Clostridia bacterium]